jgi:hypothetical protein
MGDSLAILSDRWPYVKWEKYASFPQFVLKAKKLEQNVVPLAPFRPPGPV